jgi:hypothetical protein
MKTFCIVASVGGMLLGLTSGATDVFVVFGLFYVFLLHMIAKGY